MVHPSLPTPYSLFPATHFLLTISGNPLWQWLMEPLQAGFMVKAIWVSAFVGVVCAVLSCYITLKGWSLMGDAVSHAVVPGVVVAYAMGLPFALGAFIFGFGATVIIGYVKSATRLKEDSVIGVSLPLGWCLPRKFLVTWTCFTFYLAMFSGFPGRILFKPWLQAL